MTAVSGYAYFITTILLSNEEVTARVDQEQISMYIVANTDVERCNNWRTNVVEENISWARKLQGISNLFNPG